MPEDIENYVHRIGRTGRAGGGGVATTLLGRAGDCSVLRDLAHLLTEAGQRVSAGRGRVGGTAACCATSRTCSPRRASG